MRDFLAFTCMVGTLILIFLTNFFSDPFLYIFIAVGAVVSGIFAAVTDGWFGKYITGPIWFICSGMYLILFFAA